ncbi:hypothetical protein NDN08_004566 [Rhodosorus marinus]|uniref:Uncharacterized protein n=1 Tax=Rhodosorus marinus TaxID=101924 RepID=A0AAV8UN44_9RHOD|nr:hypothetical protein NDN08_004566 [Rhodosorus marinus]
MCSIREATLLSELEGLFAAAWLRRQRVGCVAVSGPLCGVAAAVTVPQSDTPGVTRVASGGSCGALVREVAEPGTGPGSSAAAKTRLIELWK